MQRITSCKNYNFFNFYRNYKIQCDLSKPHSVSQQISCLYLSSVQFISVTQLCPTLCYSMNHSMPGLLVHHQPPEFTQTHVHLVVDAIQPSHLRSSTSPLARSPAPPSIRVFSNESTLRMRWPKYWSFSFSISPSNEHPKLISFRMDWLDLLAVQRTLLSSPTPQFKNTNSSVLSLLHSPTLTSIHDHRITHSLDQMELFWQSNVFLFNMLSGLVITFLPRNKRLLISWLWSPSAVIFEPPKIV